MTTTALGRRALCRGLVSRAMRAVTRPPGQTLAELAGAAEAGPDDPAAAAASPAASRDAAAGADATGPDYFASFDQCHTLIAEMRPFLADAIRDLGLDPRGKSDVELAREIMAHQCATPAPPRTDADDETPAAAPGPVGDH